MSEKEAKRSEIKSNEDQLAESAAFVFELKGRFVLLDAEECFLLKLESTDYLSACEEALKILDQGLESGSHNV